MLKTIETLNVLIWTMPLLEGKRKVVSPTRHSNSGCGWWWRKHFTLSSRFKSKILLLVLGIIWFLLNLIGIRHQHFHHQHLHSSPPPAAAAAAAASPIKSTDPPPTNRSLSHSSFCSASQLDIIRYQLPPDECIENKESPWLQKCSFSYASRCPDAVWLKEYYDRQLIKHDNASSSSSSLPKRTFVAMYIGCNKGMDAVNTARMGSGNANIDKSTWLETFRRLSTTNTNANDNNNDNNNNMTKKQKRQRFRLGVCGQDNSADQYVLPPLPSHHDHDQPARAQATVHCIEAMPVTATKLRETAQQLGWESWFRVQNIAMSSRDGTMLFPNQDNVVGRENEGARTCSDKNSLHLAKCQPVPTLRLDSYVTQFAVFNATTTTTTPMIDVLSIDVEGSDWEVLSSGVETLRRTRYLEFEYNWMGAWEKRSFRRSILSLKYQGFICYWPGRNGHIWRITDCWQDYYDYKYWSNVACVKPHLDEELANIMEDMFLVTLRLNQTIQYNKRIS